MSLLYLEAEDMKVLVVCIVQSLCCSWTIEGITALVVCLI